MLLLVAAVPNFVLAEGGLADTAWPTFGHDLQNTGRSPYVGPQDPVVKWEVQTSIEGPDEGGIYAQPVIGADGTIYVGTQYLSSTFYAINPDGTVKWAFIPAGMYNTFDTAAIAEDGTVYVQAYPYSDGGKLYALDPDDGSVNWFFTAGDTAYSYPKIGDDGTIYIGDDTTLYAINPDGTSKWNFTSEYSRVVIGTDGTIYALENHALYAINLDGTKKWSFVHSEGYGAGYAIAIADDGTIYIGVYNEDLGSLLFAVNPDGSQKWLVDRYSSISIYGFAIGLDGTIYANTEEDGVYALNADGTEKWHFATPDGVYTAAVVDAEGTIYFGCYDSKVYALNPDGTEKWSFATDYEIDASPAIGADGTLYVPSGEGPNSKLYAFEGPAPEYVASSSLDATANLVMAMVGIDLDRDSIDYGDIAPGESSAVETVVVTNVGTLDCDVTLEVVGADGVAQDFYEQSLYVDGGLYNVDATIASIAVDGSESVATQLQVPLSWSEVGAQDAVFVFWAQAS
jgi:outer membrane protein assembly factor BamB